MCSLQLEALALATALLMPAAFGRRRGAGHECRPVTGTERFTRPWRTS